MAKDSDNLVGSFETEDAGGLLTGFLAEEDQFDRRSLWRLGSWGVGAVGAVIVAVLANQSAIRLQREQIANADLTRQSQQIQSIAKESQNETRRLASAIDTLNGDRDRLYSRIAVLEQGLDSVTGSIARQNAAAGSPQAAPPSSPPVASPTTTSASSPSSTKSASTASSAAASSAPGSPAKAEPPVSQAAAPVVAPVATAAASIGQQASNTPAATPATPLVASKSIMAPPDPAAGKLVAPDTPPEPAAAAPAPEVVAATTSSDDAKAYDAKADAAAAASTVQRTEFAVDVGTANSVAGLRALWRGLLKSRANSALAALRPLIAVKEGNNGLGMQLRLVAGPLSDAAAAAKICAAMMEGKRTRCETTVFDGQQLALKDDTPPPSAKPAAVRPVLRRRLIVKRVMVEEPPKPQPTTLSSFFGR